jgi:hypothetical protein
MMRLAKPIGRFLLDELTMNSKHGVQLGNDTFVCWVCSLTFCAAIYLIVYYDEDFGIWISTFTPHVHVPTPPAKVAWHRLTFGTACAIGALAASLEFLMTLYARIKARLAKGLEDKSILKTQPLQKK